MAALQDLPNLFAKIARFSPTYAHLVFAAVLTIFAGSHASLTRPSSAAKPPRRPGTKKSPKPERRMEGLAPADALWYPLFTGALLAGLYFLLRWLDDPDVLNAILNWYLSAFGAFSTTHLLADSVDVAASFVFPDRFRDRGATWVVNARKRHAAGAGSSRTSPSPRLPYLRLFAQQESLLWKARDLLRRPFWMVDIYIRSLVDAKAEVRLADAVSMAAGLAVGLWFNLVSRPWWMTNLLSFGFGYQALQLISPTTFWTGTLVLTSLFFYDIYFVFFTPMMIHVATKLDVPIKLLFPRPSRDAADPSKLSMAMLGLGDVVLPGIMMALALRFDLYLFYLRKQQTCQKPNVAGQYRPSGIQDADAKSSTQTGNGSQKAVYEPATGAWGERFWLRNSEALRNEGGVFPKTYFYSSVCGYVFGLLCTLAVMHVFKHGQPALLYLVPSVLVSLWGTAYLKGDIQQMWSYSEDVGEQGSKGDKSLNEQDATPGSAKDKPLGESEGQAPVDSGVIEARGKDQGLETNGEDKDGSPTEVNGPSRSRSRKSKNDDHNALIDFTLRFSNLDDEF